MLGLFGKSELSDVRVAVLRYVFHLQLVYEQVYFRVKFGRTWESVLKVRAKTETEKRRGGKKEVEKKR